MVYYLPAFELENLVTKFNIFFSKDLKAYNLIDLDYVFYVLGVSANCSKTDILDTVEIPYVSVTKDNFNRINYFIKKTKIKERFNFDALIIEIIISAYRNKEIISMIQEFNLSGDKFCVFCKESYLRHPEYCTKSNLIINEGNIISFSNKYFIGFMMDSLFPFLSKLGRDRLRFTDNNFGGAWVYSTNKSRKYLSLIIKVMHKFHPEAIYTQIIEKRDGVIKIVEPVDTAQFYLSSGLDFIKNKLAAAKAIRESLLYFMSDRVNRGLKIAVPDFYYYVNPFQLYLGNCYIQNVAAPLRILQQRQQLGLSRLSEQSAETHCAVLYSCTP